VKPIQHQLKPSQAKWQRRQINKTNQRGNEWIEITALMN